jgi:hypothetical protein
MAGYAWRTNKGLVKRFSFDLGGMARQDSQATRPGTA